MMGSVRKEGRMPRRRLLAICATLLLLCRAGAGGATAAESAVLLSSTAPGYAPGMLLTQSERLVVPDGASLTLLLRSGEILRLRGPLDASLDLAAQGRQDGF